MIPLDLMREYVHAADNLAEAQAEIRKWEEIAAKAKSRMEDAAAKMGADEKVEVEQPPLTVMPERVSTAEIQQRTLRANKKIRGEATLAILKALPGTLPEITQRTGLKKTTVSTLVSRLQSDGLVKKDGETLMPGYEHRTATVDDLGRYLSLVHQTANEGVGPAKIHGHLIQGQEAMRLHSPILTSRP